MVFEVKDNGPGILQNDLPVLFDRYHQNCSMNHINRRGMGLGLSLCKTIIQAHGGDITIRNYEPHGTIVTFYITSKEEKQDGSADFDR